MLNYLGVEDRPGAAAYVPRWRHSAADSGGGVLMDMLHIVYLANWFMGGDADRRLRLCRQAIGRRERRRGHRPRALRLSKRWPRAGEHGLGRRARRRRDRRHAGPRRDGQQGLRHPPVRPRGTAARRQRVEACVRGRHGNRRLRHGWHRRRFPRCCSLRARRRSRAAKRACASWTPCSARTSRRRSGDRSRCRCQPITRSTARAPPGSPISTCRWIHQWSAAVSSASAHPP